MTPEPTTNPPAAEAAAPAPTGGAGSEEALDQLLRQIITGFFLLADGQGDISKWSDPAELLFGLDPDDAIGKPFFSTLIRDPLPVDAEGWKGFLEMGEEPRVRARVQLEAFHEKVGRFPLEAVFIPVKLDEGFDFSLFLEDLSFELPIDLMLLRMRQQHPVVIRALRASLDDTPQLWEGWRTAGTLVAFRPLVETPWLEEALLAREEEARLAQEEAASRIAQYEAPSVMGEVRDLEDAAAIVDKLKWASEKIEDFEERSRILDRTAADAAAARARAEAAEKFVAEAQEQLSQALSKAGTEQTADNEAQRLELFARLERVERQAQEAQDGALVQRQAAEAAQRMLADSDRAREQLVERLAQLESRIGEAADAGRVAAAEQARAEAFAAVEVAREELQARLEVLERSRAQGAEEAADQAREKLAARLDALERSREAEAGFVRAELERVAAQAAEAAGLREEVEALRTPREDPRLREELSQVRARADEIATVASEVRRLQGPVADIVGLRSQVEKLEGMLAEVAAQRAAAQAAESRAAEQESGLASLRRDVAELRSSTAEALTGLGHLAAAAQPADDLEEIRARLDAAVAREVPLAPEDRGRLETAQREAEEARAGVDAVRHQADELRAQAAQLREEAGSLRAQLNALQEGDGQARHDLDGLRREHDDVRHALEEARREREEIRGQLREALRIAEDARAAAEARPPHQPAASLDESGIRRLERANDEFSGLRQDTDALRARMDELVALAEASERRAEEARAEAAAARHEGIETREEAREAQRTAREAGDRVDLVDRGAANVLAEIQAQGALVEELGAIARSANETAHDTRAAAADTEALVGRLEAELQTARQQASAEVELAAREHAERAATGAQEAADRTAAELREELALLRAELEATRSRVDASDDADLREALAALRSELDGREDGPGLRERIDELKSELHSGVPRFRAELEVLSAGLSELAGRVEDSSSADDVREELATLRARIEDDSVAASLRDELASVRDLVAGGSQVEALREQVGELRERLEDRTELSALQSALDELRARPAPELPDIAPAVVEAASALPALRQAVDEMQAAAFGERLAELSGELKASRQDQIEARLVIEQRLSEMAGEVVTARGEAEQARQTVDALREELSTLREYAAAVRAETGAATQTATAARTAVNAADRKFEKLRADMAALTATLETWKGEVKEARKAAVAARKDAESARQASEKAGAANEANAERFTEVWREILNLKPSPEAAGNGSAARRAPVKPAFGTASAAPPEERAPRAGFDDDETPMALVALNGKFTELNPAFTRLVGYKEHEFARATWPSVHDREIYADQKKQLAELLAGERESVKVHSTYMHGAGLMVPVLGELTLARDAAGEPAHLLLVAEDRQNPLA